MEYWKSAAIWWAMLCIIASINARRWVLRIPWLYWLGAVGFGAGGTLAAHYHRGPVANAWGAVAFAGWLALGAGLYGFPPRKPVRRVR